MITLTCGECKQVIDAEGKRYDYSDMTTVYYSCREKDCHYDVCTKCAVQGIRHEHRGFTDNTPTFMMTTLNGRASHLVEEDDERTPTVDTATQLCGTCRGPVSNNTRCKKCKAPYCSHECLKKDWNRHRALCTKPV